MASDNSLNMQSFVSARLVASVVQHLEASNQPTKGSYSRVIKVVLAEYAARHGLTPMTSTEEAFGVLETLGFSMAQMRDSRKRRVFRALREEEVHAEDSETHTATENRTAEITALLDEEAGDGSAD